MSADAGSTCGQVFRPSMDIPEFAPAIQVFRPSLDIKKKGRIAAALRSLHVAGGDQLQTGAGLVAEPNTRTVTLFPSSDENVHVPFCGGSA